MVYGKVVEKLAQIYENDEGGIVGGGSEPVDERTECPKSKPNSNIMLTTGVSNDALAKDKRTGLILHTEAVKAEQRTKFLRNMSIRGLGTNRIEENKLKSRRELVRDTGRRVPEIVEEMERKVKDAKKVASEKRWKRDSWRKEMEKREDIGKSKVQNIVKKIKR